MARPVALITGASSGIGAELARLAASDGYDLIIVARSQDPLRKLAEELSARHAAGVRVIVQDLSAPAAAQAIYTELRAAGVEIDLLVNNAGFARFGSFWESDPRVMLELLEVNMVVLTHLTRLFLPHMVKRRQGAVLNIASTAAFQPGPLMAEYYASKAYVLSFSVALANELKGTGVKLTVLCPGPTHTGFERRAGLDLSRLFKWVPVSDAQSVARAGYRAMKRGRTIVIPGVLNRVVAFSTRLAPLTLVSAVARSLQERVA